jgi:hypothetical protein
MAVGPGGTRKQNKTKNKAKFEEMRVDILRARPPTYSLHIFITLLYQLICFSLFATKIDIT